MEVIRNFDSIDPKETIVTVGTFDGLHLGHQEIFRQMLEKAGKENKSTAVVTFSPHPQLVVARDKPLKLLTSLEEKVELLNEFGIDSLVIIDFTEDFEKLSAEDFISNYLVEQLNVSSIFIGEDHCFGSNREGKAGNLKEFGKKYNFDVNIVDTLKLADKRVKSSAIRGLIENDDFDQAVKCLGHPYLIMGLVVEGHKRGRELEFPTANIEVGPDKLLPQKGVYAGSIQIEDEIYSCLANIGTRPTFGGDEDLGIEAHILDFSGNIYQKQLQLNLVKKIRPEIKFDDETALKEQLIKDKQSILST